MAGTRSTVSSVTGPLQMVELMVQTAMIDICPVSADLRPNTPSLSLPVDLPSPAGGRGVAWPRESSQPKLFPEATNQFQVGSRRAEQVQQPRPRHQLTSYPRAMRRRGPPGHRLVRRGARDISLARSAHHTT